MYFSIDKPATVFVEFNEVPKTFFCMKKDGGTCLYFFRELAGKEDFKKIRFNINHPGSYMLLSGSITDIKPFEKISSGIKLPPRERSRMKPFHCVVNSEMQNTPARNFTHIGRIELSPEFMSWPYAIRLFIMLHEIGHFFYKTETYCDLYAAKVFIDVLGFNPSTAFYSLSKVLKRNPENNYRLSNIYKNLVA